MGICHFKYPYNKKDDHFVIDSEIRGLKWITHPDLISYVEETDPKKKVFTEIELYDGPEKFI
uniref:Uncharacterized protein n=1 Tax=Pithovirus LCPAC403 TaxID=2506596 RepID=A0A481ZCS4_9VIRU|nr:MAG: hypothetical protein LCPAC403_04090 [Pithovirus LCPAC403]